MNNLRFRFAACLRSIPVSVSLSLLLLFVSVSPLQADSPATSPEGGFVRQGSGALLWRFVSGGSIRGRPLVGKDRVYVLSEDWYLYALAPDGSKKWRYDLGGRVADFLAEGPDGTVYAGTARGVIHAVNPAGKLIWTFRADSEPLEEAVFDAGGTLYFGTEGEILYSVSHTGRLRWRYSAPGGICAGPVLSAEGRIFIGSGKGVVYALDGWGDTAWSVTVSGRPGALAPAPGGGVIVGTDDGQVLRYDGNGQFVQGSGAGAGILNFPERDGKRYCVTETGAVFGFSPDGSLERLMPAGPARSAPVVRGGRNLQLRGAALSADGTFFFTTAGGSVLAVSEAGEPLWEYRMQLPPGKPVLSPGGTLFVGSEDWVLYAFRGGRPPVPAVPPPAAQSASRAPSAFTYLDELARSGQLELKEIALGDIEKLLENGSTRDSGGYLKRTLRYLADEALFSITFRRRTVANNYPLIRSRALDLLARIADTSDMEYFLRLLRYEYDPYVRAAEIRAVGAVRSDPDGKAVDALAGILSKMSTLEPDGRVAEAAVDALESIYDYHGFMLRAPFYAALRSALTGDFPRRVREKALILLRRTEDN